jgi:hypothetical protein
MTVLFVKNYMIFLVNLHVIANIWFPTGASGHSNNNDGSEDFISISHHVHDNAEVPSGI